MNDATLTPAPRTFMERLRGNIMGGITAAVLSVPVCVGFGILALAPLGAEYVQHGVLAGLYAAVCGGLVSAAFVAPPSEEQNLRSD